MINIGITGHRKLLYPDIIREEIRGSLRYFIALHGEGNITAISAMAAGADTIFAQEALNLKIPLKAIIPFAAEEYRKDFAPEEWQRVQQVLDHPLCTLSIHDSAPIENDKARAAAYLATGEALAEQADILLAVWDEKPARGRGGTAEIVNHALAKGREVHLIKGWRINSEEKEANGQLLQEEFNRLDKLAIKFKERRFEPAWIGGIVLGVLAAVSFATGLAYAGHLTPGQRYLFSAGEAIFLGLSALLLLWLARRWKKQFLAYRRSAEYLRIILRFRQAGIQLPEVPDSSLLSEQIISKITEKTATPSVPLGLHHARRLTWCFAAEQDAYQEKNRINRFSDRLHVTEKLLTAVKRLFFLVALLNFILETQHYFHRHWLPLPAGVHSLLILLWIVLPSIYAALEGVKYFSEWHVNIAISKKMRDELQDIMKKTLACGNETALATEAGKLQYTLERENKDWLENFGQKETEIKP